MANEVEAELVRHIMRSYLRAGSVDDLAQGLNAEGHRTKVQQGASGPHRGGCPFRRGTLFHMLTNQIYRGKIVHKGNVFDGEHEAIVAEELWEAVQNKLKERTAGSSRRLRARSLSLLTGMLLEGEDRPMTPTHATSGGRRYRYYITRPDHAAGSSTWRVPAHDLEILVCARIAELLNNQHYMVDQLGALDTQQVARALAQADLLSATLRSGSNPAKLEVLLSLLDQVWLGDEQVLVHVSRSKLLSALHAPAPTSPSEPIIVSCPATKVRRGHQLRLIIPGPEPEHSPPPLTRDDKLVTLLSEAQAARKLVLAAPQPSINAIAAAHRRCRTHLARLLAVSCLAPDIVTAVLEGRQPATMNARSLLTGSLPVVWSEQRRMLGFAAVMSRSRR